MKNRLAILLICAAALLVGPATSAQADTGTQLAFANNSQTWIAVDPGGGHVFVSGGPGNSSIEVLNYSGAVVKTITGEGGASAMALDAATHTLYVALHDATAISEINTQTLTETTRFSTAPYPDPTSLVIAGGKLWFSCAEGNSGCLVSANLNGTGMSTPISGGNLPLFLAAGGSNNHLLAFGYSEDEPPNLYVYDVSGSTPSLVKYSFDPNNSSDVADMTFDPSGSHLLLATGAPYFIQSLTATTLLPSASYPTGPYPVAVAVTADGKYVAAGTNTGTGQGNDVFVYPVGSTTPVRTWALSSEVPGVLAHSLAFTPDASRLFVVTQTASGKLAFDVLTKPTAHLTATGITLHRSAASVRYGRRVKLKAHVTGARSGKVDLFAATSSSVAKRVASGKLKSGSVTFSVKLKQKTAYSAQLEQAQSYAPATSKTVVVAVKPVLSVVTHPDGVVQLDGQRVSRTRLIARVRPALPSFEQLEFVVQRREGGSWVTTATNQFPVGNGTVNAFLYSNEGGLHRVQAVYGGDAAYPACKSPWRSFVATAP